MDADIALHADRYIAFWQALSHDRLAALSEFMTADIHFSDPFNDLHGLPAVKSNFARLYGKIHDIDVVVHDRARGTGQTNAEIWYLRWTFAYSLKSGKRLSIEGMSEVHLEPDGRASSHIDYWDAAGQVYEKFPLIGPVLRGIRRRL